MKAIGSTAYNPELTPYTMTLAAEQLDDTMPEDAEEIRSMARDFAEIQNLPEYEGWVRGESNGMENLRRYV